MNGPRSYMLLWSSLSGYHSERRVYLTSMAYANGALPRLGSVNQDNMEIKEDDLVWSKQLHQIVRIGWRKPNKAFIWFIPSGSGGCWLPYEDLEKMK